LELDSGVFYRTKGSTGGTFNELLPLAGKSKSINDMFLRRLGPEPHANGAQSAGGQGCPDIFELSDGDFAVIGIDMTETAISKLPPSAGCGPDERIVRVPRRTLLLAKGDIPNPL
jgi:hypothetical protein